MKRSICKFYIYFLLIMVISVSFISYNFSTTIISKTKKTNVVKKQVKKLKKVRRIVYKRSPEVYFSYGLQFPTVPMYYGYPCYSYWDCPGRFGYAYPAWGIGVTYPIK